VAEGGLRAGGQRRLLGDLERAAQLVLVLCIAQCLILVEPLGRQGFRCDAPGLRAAFQPDAGADHGLPAMGGGDDAEAKGHAEAEGPFPPFRLQQGEARRVRHPIVSITPCR
jgi:hypothetical protein